MLVLSLLTGCSIWYQSKPRLNRDKALATFSRGGSVGLIKFKSLFDLVKSRNKQYFMTNCPFYYAVDVQIYTTEPGFNPTVQEACVIFGSESRSGCNMNDLYGGDHSNKLLFLCSNGSYCSRLVRLHVIKD